MLPPEVLREVSDFTLRLSTPIYWHDRQEPFPKRIRGGTCFVLRFDSGLIGITAAHVLRVYEATRREVHNLVCQLRLTKFTLHQAIIECDDDLDIATFRVTEEELTAIGGAFVDCRGNNWPPPPLVKM